MASLAVTSLRLASMNCLPHGGVVRVRLRSLGGFGGPEQWRGCTAPKLQPGSSTRDGWIQCDLNRRIIEPFWCHQFRSLNWLYESSVMSTFWTSDGSKAVNSWIHIMIHNWFVGVTSYEPIKFSRTYPGILFWWSSCWESSPFIAANTRKSEMDLGSGFHQEVFNTLGNMSETATESSPIRRGKSKHGRSVTA